MTLDDQFTGRLVTRAACGLVAPKSRTSLRASFGTTIHYEGVDLGVYLHSSCPSKVRGIQRFHMEQRGWSDIAYSLIACQHGAIFECRGRGIRTAANGTNPGNDQAHAVCALMGPHDRITAELEEALAIAAAWLNEPDIHGDGINGHRDWKPTSCPSDALYARLPAIRFRASHIAAGAGASRPIPPAIIGPELKEDAMHQLVINIPVADDDNNGTGRGYVDLTKGFAGLTETIGVNRVVAYGYGGDNPGDGWGAKALAPLELVNVGGVARLSVPGHEVRNGSVAAYVTIA